MTRAGTTAGEHQQSSADGGGQAIALFNRRGYATCVQCGDCGGGRLKKEAYNFRIGPHTIADLWRMPVSDLHPLVKRKLLESGSHDTIRSSAMTGKPSRQLLNAWIRAWHEPDAPAPLPAPWQGMLNEGSLIGAYERGMEDLMGTPVGQGVGLIRDTEDVRGAFSRLLEEYGTAVERSYGIYSRSLESD
jgi:hypothetical protein